MNYVKAVKRKGFITTEYRIDGEKYFVGKRVPKEKIKVPNPFNF